MSWLMRNRGKVLVAVDLSVAVLVAASIASANGVVRVITCLGRNLSDPPCGPIDVRAGGLPPWAPYAALLLIASPSLVAGWWWLVRRRDPERASRTDRWEGSQRP